MKNLLIIVLLLTSMTFAKDKPKGYIQISTASLTFDDIGTGVTFSPKALVWTAGYQLKEFTIPFLDVKISSALELNLISTRELDTVKNIKHYGTVTTSLNNYYSGYLKVPLPIGDYLDLNLYGGLSYAGSTHFLETGETIENEFEAKLSYGVGLQYSLPKNVYVHIRYMQQYKNLNAIEFGFGIKF